MPKYACLGDTSSHGGAITSAAANVYAEGKRVARIGDILTCAVHGPVPIVTGSSKTLAEGAFIARHGDLAECGATLIASAVNTQDE